MLTTLEKLSREIGIEESEAQRIATYAGLRRVGGAFDDREFLLAYTRHLSEELYGVVAVECAAMEVRGGVPPKKVVRGHLSARRKRANTPWAGNLFTR